MGTTIPSATLGDRQTLHTVGDGCVTTELTDHATAGTDDQDTSVSAQRVIDLRNKDGTMSSLQAVSHTTRRRRIKEACVTTGVLGVLWWIITDGSATSWLVGAPALASAVWVRSRLDKGTNRNISIVGLARFIPYFVYESLRGGASVAARALAPRMQIEPRFVRYDTTLKSSSARVLFANCVSLLPGTLAAELCDEWLEVHIICDESSALAELNTLEQAISRLYGSEPTS